MSLAIFERLTAMVRSSPDASTTQSRVAWASKWFAASAKADPKPLLQRRRDPTPEVDDGC